MKQFISLALGVLVLAGGCAKKSAVRTRAAGEDSHGVYNAAALGGEWANEEAVLQAFTLDYRPQMPEGAAADGSGKKAPDTGGSAAAGGGRRVAGGGGQVVGGGLRKLSDYKTAYYNPQEETERVAAIRAAQAAALEGTVDAGAMGAGSLSVVDWGPRGEYSAQNKNPSVYVVFNRPVVPLSALGAPSDSSPVFSITPKTRGVFRWYGTAFLSFEGEEPLQSQQVYTIQVAPTTKSIYGDGFSGEHIFTFTTERLDLLDIAAGEDFKKQNRAFYFKDADVPPAAARFITLIFNYPVQAADMREFVTVTDGAETFDFTLKNLTETKLLAELKKEPAFQRTITVTLQRGAKSKTATRGTESPVSKTFSTPDGFSVKNIGRQSGYGRYINLVDFEFSYPLNESTVSPAAIQTKPKMQITAENIEVWGNTVRLFNLPVSYGDKFTVTMLPVVKDRYGRLLDGEYSQQITVPEEPPPSGSVRFLNEWDSMAILEAQFPPRYLFEYKNIAKDSWYSISKMSNPFSKQAADTKFVELETGKKNAKYFADIDLKPFLVDGKGFILFEADINLLPKLEKKQDNGRYYRYEKDFTAIQVTDLGLSVRYAFNKAAVLVTSLSTGTPVSGAEVKLFGMESKADYANIKDAPLIGAAVSGEDGLAVINAPGLVIRNLIARRGEIAVYAKKGVDRVVFTPDSHNTWRYNIYTGFISDAEEITPVVFLFSDRGIYKPGETVTFRGVDRSKVLGQYAVYTGEFLVQLEEDSYGGKVIAEITGETSDSGGFWGRLAVPETLKPGAYRLSYRRGAGKSLATSPVTVAFFERLKFEANISGPPVAVISGSDINASLNASYLSGGSLSGAEYDVNWYRDISFYHPNTAETRGFAFGPGKSGDGRRFVAGSEGMMLSGDGSAKLTQKTGDEPVKGAPYLYTASALVRDLSNQQIAAETSVLVHPALFYIGARRQSKGGFAKAGSEAAFDYVTVGVNGEKTTGASLFLRTGPEAGVITAALYREEWRRVQQAGVNGYVYNEYIREQVEDSAQKIKIENGGGSFKFKPSASGYHILRLTAEDRDGKTALTEIGFYVTGGKGGYWNSGYADEIRLVPDRNKYNPGDTAVIMVQSELPKGRYLVTVERDGIYTENVITLDSPAGEIEIPIARNYVPVVYVAVSSYSVRSGPPTHEYGSPDLDKPKGYFGVTKLFVDPNVRSFSVAVDSGKPAFRPGEEVTITMTATHGGRPLKNAELTLMAVDRGVLDLINYHVPNPIDYFYSEERFPLRVRGGDSRADLMDPVTYSVKNLQGGDASDSKIEERADFNPTAVFEPALITDENGIARCTFKLPDTLTTYRITVFGINGDIFSLKESEIRAQNLINVREVLPRRLRERDTAEAGVLITNMDDKPHVVSVNLAIAPPRSPVDEASGRRKPAGAAFVDGAAEREVTVGAGENAVLYFDIAAVSAGFISLEWTSSSPGTLNERLVNELQIEHPFIMETVTTTGSVSAEETQKTESFVLPSYIDHNRGRLSVTLDATRLAELDAAINYVFRYPYGCLEQRSAAVLPLVIFGEYMDALSLKSDIENPKKVVEAELKNWVNFQLPDGGFPYWPGGERANLYVSVRIAHILAIAQDKNIKIPAELNINKLLLYLESSYRETAKWGMSARMYDDRDYFRTWIIYVLALHGRMVDQSSLAAITAQNDVDAAALALAGLAYRKLGRKEQAAAAAGKLRVLVRQTARGVDIAPPLRKNSYADFYNTPLERLALALEFFVQQYPGDDINTRILHTLLQAKKARGGYWDNTAVTARVLSAVDALIRAENLEKLDVKAGVTIEAAELLKGSFKGLGAKPVSAAAAFDEPPLAALPRDRMQRLTIHRSGQGSVYYTAEMRYAIPLELQGFRDEGIGVFMRVFDAQTNEEVRGTALAAGKTYRARIKLSTTHNRTYVALRAPVPSGAEILDAAFSSTPKGADEKPEAETDDGYYWKPHSQVSYQAIYDNEIHYFYDYIDAGETELNFLFRTARRGVYPTPPITAECMYEPEIFGRSSGLLWTIE